MNNNISEDEKIGQLINHQMIGGQAFVPLTNALENINAADAGKIPNALPHSIWELVWHMRMSTEDILSYSRDQDYQSGKWPDDYWPASPSPESEAAWQQEVTNLLGSVEAMQNLVTDKAANLMQPVKASQGNHTLLREALLVIAHNAYHTGQLILVRKALGIW